ncbi:MAG: acetate--CoA ligase, partial [Phycisphaerae bacterium]|nr:acetate--CoA ligase [Phycisphaerae bacterium]
MSDLGNIESILHEDRIFDPPADCSARIGGAYIGSMDEYNNMYKRSIEDPDAFWGEVADELDWFERWDTVQSSGFPDVRWFDGGTTNMCHNCIDRQINMGHGDDTAIVWEGEPCKGTPEVRTLTYYDLHAEVCKFANALKAKGVKKGDVVTIYMGMVPELAIATLACARIGAPHSVIFGGFSSQAIADRVDDAKSTVVITCDGSWRRGSVVPLKDNVDAAAKLTSYIDTVIVVKRCENEIAWTEGRDHWWSELCEEQEEDCPCEHMESEDMLFLLYTSGSTGKPKGIVHTTGGYMVYTYLTSKWVFNLKPDNDQLYWCTADVGWITGHSYIIYGILPNRVPTLMYEGAPNFPDSDRFWDIVERHKVTQFYTAPTAIRAFMKWGDEHPNKHNLSSLKVLGTVGEPINPEAWMWYREIIGGNKCPIVDTWWQTETGGHMLTPLPAATPTTPGSCTQPFFGIDAAVVNDDGSEVGENEGGLLVVRKPWPSTLRGVYGDRDRFIDTYFARIDGMYLAGDSARRDENKNFWIM